MVTIYENDLKLLMVLIPSLVHKYKTRVGVQTLTNTLAYYTLIKYVW